MKRIYTLLIICCCFTLVNAQSWNFKSLGDTDLANIKADTGSWEYDSSNDRYYNLSTYSAAALMANGSELELTKGLLFTASKTKTIRIDVKKQQMWLAGSAKLIIPNVEAGKYITIVAKTSSSSTARTINLPDNVENTSGNFGKESTDEVTYKGCVTTTGDVTISMSGALYFYSISISDTDSGSSESGSETTTSTNDLSTSANAARNQMEVSLTTGDKRYYNTADVTDVAISDDNNVTVTQSAGSYTFSGNVSQIAFRKADEGSSADVDNQDGKVEIIESKGWKESAYVTFKVFDGADSYNVYVKGGQYSDYTKIDAQLVRQYADYMRADAVGLTPASGYSLKVVPVSGGNETTSAANEATNITVSAYDRTGFAHFGATEGIGAYNNDGTLKDGAHVIYVTKDNAKTISLTLANGTTYTGLQNIIYGYQKGTKGEKPLCVRIIGTISKDDCDELLSSAEGLQIKGKNSYSALNITIEGIGEDATTTGFGFLIRNAGSVELRNFANMLCLDDAVSIDTDNERIWVHNLDLFYGNTGGDSDQAKGDGTIDLKGDSRYITISYNHFWDTGKSSLCGMKSESGPNWITYHHNWFDHSDSRHPRIRTMSVHVYNNYYDGVAKYGVGAAYQSNAFVESNYFRNCKYPMLISRQGSDVYSDSKGTFSGEDGGMIKSFGNYITGAKRYVTYQQDNTQFDAYEASSRDEQVPSTVAAYQGGRTYDNFDTDSLLMYSCTPDEAANVPDIVTGWLGAGRMNHGDFQWTFNNTTEDSNYDVISALKTALQNYQSSLVKVQE